MKTKFRIALAQINPALGNIEKNMKKHIDFINLKRLISSAEE